MIEEIDDVEDDDSVCVLTLPKKVIEAITIEDEGKADDLEFLKSIVYMDRVIE